MPTSITSILAWVASQQQGMIDRVIPWANVNSHSHNIASLAKLAELIAADFAPLGGRLKWHDLPPAMSIDNHGQTAQTPLGRALTITKRPDAHLRVLFNIHLDTVYPPESPFQSVREESGKLYGPGVADAKGGIAVMLTALKALEQSPHARRVGWQVLINPDEEIGSPGSASLLEAAARSHHFGLLFEPSLPDGAIVDRRRGSGSFSIVIHGRAAHAGRDFGSGRSALLAAAKLALQLHALNEKIPGVTLNIGSIDGGAPVNVVPDLAICRINVRTTEPFDADIALSAVNKLIAELNTMDCISTELHGKFANAPKIPDDRTLRLLDAILSCGKELGLSIPTRPSGGASDGNKLSAAGLPNIDSLGARGDRIHSPHEYLFTESLAERAQLTAMLLLKIANADIDPAPFCR
jgi:glutamate carboxypeptidase